MDEHEDTPFQNVKQESPFQVPMNSIAQQASYAASQMAQMRPESAGPMGAMQEESPFQPQREEEPENQGNFSSNLVEFRICLSSYELMCLSSYDMMPCRYSRLGAFFCSL